MRNNNNNITLKIIKTIKMQQEIASVQFTNNFCNNENDDENDKIK